MKCRVWKINAPVFVWSGKEKSLAPALVLLLCFWLVSGCQAKQGGMADHQVRSTPLMEKKASVRMIVKFKDSVSDPSRPEFVAELSGTIGAKMSYFRPMSGGAHVFYVETHNEKNTIKNIQEKLSQRPDVLYVEPDEKMMRQ